MIDRVIVAGGGTGGHLFPGLAVVEELRRRHPAVEVLFVGTARGIEARVLPALDERLELIEVQPLKGRRPKELLSSLARLPAAASGALGLIRRYRPDLVIGVGGYASGPVLAAAVALGVPTAVLEQNAHVGLTNRMLARVVGRAYVSFATTATSFPRGKARTVGNPIRRSFVRAARRASSDPAGFEARSTKILVLGGSQGARVLNEVAPRAIAEAAPGVAVIHQTGSGMVDEVRAAYAELGVEAEVTAFIDDMATAYASAQVVVARAGATTVAEVCAIGRPSILVPFPHAADDHQTKNARALEVAGAAVCIPEAALDTASLAVELRALTGDVTRRRAMAEAARGVGRPDAAAATVDDLCAWLGCPAARAQPSSAPPSSGPPERLDPNLRAFGSSDGGSSDDGPSEGELQGEPSESDPRADRDLRRAQGGAAGLRGQRPYVPSARRAARRSGLPPHRRIITVSAWD